MKITTNLIEKYTNTSILKPENRQYNNSENSTKLPLSDIKGISQVNSNLPVNYTKTGEISVPGLNNKASVYKLSNGQKVIIQKKDGPLYIRTSFNVGSLNEDDEKRGISHFIEHNLFNGSKNLAPGEYDTKVEELGGYTNAYTSFGETLNDNSLEEAIKLNAYQTQFPTFPKEPLEREKEPVKSEIDMCSDNAENKAYTIMLKNMFGLETNSEDIIIGTKENINKLTREDLFDYYNTWYTPDNAITVITGDVDEQEAINLVSKYYNKQPDYSKINQRKIPDLKPLNKASRVDIKHKNNPNAIMLLGFPVEEGTSFEDYYKLKFLFIYILSSNSEISQKLDKYGIGLDFAIENLSSDPAGAASAYSKISLPDEYTEEVLKIIYEELTNLYNNPPKQEDITRIVNSLILSINTNEDNAMISSQLLDIVKNNNFNYFENCQNTLKSLTPQDVSDTAKKFLDLSKASICISHPSSISDEQIKSNYKNAQSGANTVSFGKSQSPSERFNALNASVSRYKLQNNMQLAFTKSEGTPEAHFAMSFEADTDKNISKAATSVLTLMLNRGNAFHDNCSFDKIMTDLNTKIEIFDIGSYIGIFSDFPAEKSNEVIPLIKQTLLYPNFSQTEFDRAKKLIKDDIQNSSKNPYSKIYQTIFPDNKYFASDEEKLKALDNLTLQDVKNLYYKILNNSQSLITASAPAEQLSNLKTTVFNEFSSNLPVFNEFVPQKSSHVNAYKPNTKELFLTDTEENAQAQIIQSYLYKDSNNVSDIAKIKILNHILGEGMSSRLFQDLRNNEKIAYHVASNIDAYYDTGLINLEIETSTDSAEASSENITKAINAFKRNVEKLKTENVTEQELNSAKNALKTSLLSAFHDSESEMFYVMENIDNVYGLNCKIELLKAIDAVTADDVKAAANYVFEYPPINSIVASKKTLNAISTQ